MKVTVVVRTYKRPDFLKQVLASIHYQSYKNWEVIIFDDSGELENFNIYTQFKNSNKDKRVTYITTRTPYDLFTTSWNLSFNISEGDILVRVDDDDLLSENSLEYISTIYSKNPDLDFSYGSSVGFNNNYEISYVSSGRTPLELPFTRDIWLPYTIPNNSPWKHPWTWGKDYYTEPRPYTSIIHASKANQMCITHPYVMRVKSIQGVVDTIKLKSKFVDDLEFFGTLDYLGFKHGSLKQILYYIRQHDGDRITNRKLEDNTTLWDDILKIRDTVDEVRPSGFNSNVIQIDGDYDNSHELDIQQKQLTNYFQKISQFEWK